MPTAKRTVVVGTLHIDVVRQTPLQRRAEECLWPETDEKEPVNARLALPTWKDA